MQGNIVIGSHYWNMDTFEGTNQYPTYHKEEPEDKTKESRTQCCGQWTEEVCSGARWWQCFKRKGVITLLSCTHGSIRWRWELTVRFKLKKTVADIDKNYVLDLENESLTGVGSNDNGAGLTSGGYDLYRSHIAPLLQEPTLALTLYQLVMKVLILLRRGLTFWLCTGPSKLYS